MLAANGRAAIWKRALLQFGSDVRYVRPQAYYAKYVQAVAHCMHFCAAIGTEADGAVQYHIIAVG